jgi:3-oxoisoapionate decarboxylase
MSPAPRTPQLGRIGIGSWTYPWAVGTITEHQPAKILTPAGLVERAVKLGAKVVQVVDNLPLDRLDPMELDLFREAALAADVEMEIGTRGVEPAHLLKYIGIARQLGARLVRTMNGWHGKPRPLNEVERDLREILPVLEETGILLAIENYEAYSTRELAKLIRTLGHPHVGVCLDLTNSFGALESCDEILDALVPLTMNLHLKEFVVERTQHLMGFAFNGRPVGQGQLPLEKILTRLAEAGRKPNVIIEHWTPFAGSLEESLALEESWARASVAYLKSLPWFRAGG